MQEMLVSYAVQIDESGLTRLYSILEENQSRAAAVAEAFAAAEGSLRSLSAALLNAFSGDSGTAAFLKVLSGVKAFPGDLSTAAASVVSDAGRQTREFTRFASALSEGISKALRPAAAVRSTPGAVTNPGVPSVTSVIPDISGVTEAVDGISRKLNSTAPKLHLSADASGILTAASSAAARVRSMFSDIRISVSTEGATPVKKLSTGGRFDRPTFAQVAEDGDPEYIIPVKKTARALPLIRDMLAELPTNMLEQAISGLGSMNPASMSLAHSTVNNTVSRNLNVSAPCNVNVTGYGSDPKQVGDAAARAVERHLLRTVQSVFA